MDLRSNVVSRIAYRVGQFSRAFFPRIETEEHAIVRSLLNPAQQVLFYRMSASLQRHHLNVYHALVREGYTDREVLVAALLHDVGKGRIRLFERVLIVLLQATVPSFLRWLANERSFGWRKALAHYLRHPEIGSALVSKTGAPSTVVQLIAQQEARNAEDPRLKALQWADDQN